MHVVANSLPPVSRPVRYLLTLLALLGALVLVVVYIWMLEPILRWDLQASLWLAQRRTVWLDTLMLHVTLFSDLPLSMAYCAVMAAYLAIQRFWLLSVTLCCAFFSTSLSVTIIKLISQRARPSVLDTGIELVMSFPSGHAARAAFILGAAALLLSRGCQVRTRGVLLTLAAGMTALVGLSRVYLGVHWPSDVVAGVILAGIMLTGFIWQLHHGCAEHPSASTPTVAIGLALFMYVIYAAWKQQTQMALYGLG